MTRSALVNWLPEILLSTGIAAARSQIPEFDCTEYRIIHGDDIIDWLTIASVQRILTDAGVDLTTLTEVRAGRWSCPAFPD